MPALRDLFERGGVLRGVLAAEVFGLEGGDLFLDRFFHRGRDAVALLNAAEEADDADGIEMDGQREQRGAVVMVDLAVLEEEDHPGEQGDEGRDAAADPRAEAFGGAAEGNGGVDGDEVDIDVALADQSVFLGKFRLHGGELEGGRQDAALRLELDPPFVLGDRREVVRGGGSFRVSAAQATAADRHRVRLAAESVEARQAIIPAAAGPPESPVVKWDRDGKFPVVVRASHDGTLLHLDYEVEDASPWVNHGKDWQALFKTGDGIDLQLGPAADPKRGEPVPGDLRLFIAPMGEENVVVLYRHRAPDAPPGEAVNFQSPWRSAKVDSVRRLDSAKIEVTREGGRYRMKASIPLFELRLDPARGLKMRGDFGVIYGDAAGAVNVFRNYWSNRATGLVNDVPGEILLTPALWSEIDFSQPASSK